jgi:hypothetical protein
MTGSAQERRKADLALATDLRFTKSDWNNMHRRGAVFLVTRRGGDFHAQRISPVAMFACAGIRDELLEKALAESFGKRGAEQGDADRRTVPVLFLKLI